MTCARCAGVERFFDDGVARRELRRYRRKGPSRTSRMLIDAVLAQGIEGRTVLDVGGGVGAVHHELLAAGAAKAVDADASPAYVEASRAEAERQGHADRIRHEVGDFVELAPRLDGADVVVLDRVICCYADMDGLVGASLAKAERVYGYVLPRSRLAVRIGIRTVNALQALRRHPFRAYVHDPGAVEALVRAAGFQRRFLGQTGLWRVEVHAR